MHSLRPILLVFLAAALAAPAGAQTKPWTGASVVNDPEWRKRFLGSYGFLSGAEPQIDAAELEVLREVIEVMKANPAAAAEMLKQQTGEGSSAALDFILANLEFQGGELEAAKEHYQSALKKFPDFRRAHKNLGLLLVQQSEFAAALQHLSRAAELGDRDGRTYGLMGYCYITLENHLAAEMAYRQAVLQEPETRDWKLGLARAQLALEHFKDAAGLFESLIEADPSDPTPWLLQANAYVGLDQPRKAAVNLEAVRALGKARSSSLVLLGDIYMNAGMTELAKGAYLEVIETDAKGAQFDTAYRAADLLVRTRAYGDAEEVLASIGKRYGGLSEEDELRVLTLEAKLARAQGRGEQAAGLLQSIVERDGTRGDALLELASYHRSQDRLEKAVLLIERAEKLDAFEYQAYLEHAQLLVSEKQYGAAAQYLRKALDIKREPRVELFLSRVEQAARG